MKQNNAKKDIFNKPHHISIVVKDATKAQTFYESIGIGPWVEYPPMKEYIDLTVMDKEGFYDLNIRCAQIGPLELQLIQPGKGKSLYKEFLENKGEGVFHIGFEVDDIAAADKNAENKSLSVLSSGRRIDGSGFSYYEKAQDAGVILLARQTKTPGPQS